MDREGKEINIKIYYLSIISLSSGPNVTQNLSFKLETYPPQELQQSGGKQEIKDVEPPQELKERELPPEIQMLSTLVLEFLCVDGEAI